MIHSGAIYLRVESFTADSAFSRFTTEIIQFLLCSCALAYACVSACRFLFLLCVELALNAMQNAGNPESSSPLL